MAVEKFRERDYERIAVRPRVVLKRRGSPDPAFVASI